MYGRTTALALLFPTLLAFSMPTSAIPLNQALPDKGHTKVVIAEDQTLESQCTQWIGSSENQVACAANTVLGTRETTLAEVKRLGITNYTVLTGDPEKDRSLHNQVVAQETARLSSGPVITACTAQSPITMGVSFTVGNGTRVNAQVSYARTNTCAVTNVVDRAMADGTAAWNYSTVQSTTFSRTVGINGTWTPYYGLMNSGVGQRWAATICNNSLNLGCVTAGQNFF